MCNQRLALAGQASAQRGAVEALVNLGLLAIAQHDLSGTRPSKPPFLSNVAIGVFVYQQTGSAFTVAMMTMLRLLPMGLFGVFLGAMAEHMERRLRAALTPPERWPLR